MEIQFGLDASIEKQNQEELRQVQAILSIFNSTKNVFPISPSKQSEAKFFNNLLRQSKAIPPSCLGLPSNGKTREYLLEIFCEIAKYGNLNISKIDGFLSEIQQDTQNIKNGETRIESMKSSINKKQLTIVELNKRINLQNQLIKNKQQEQTKIKTTLAEDNKSINEIQHKINNAKTDLANAQANLKNGSFKLSSNKVTLQSKKQLIQKQEKSLLQIDLNLKQTERLIGTNSELLNNKRIELASLKSKKTQIQQKMNNINGQSEIKHLLIRRNQLQTICNNKDAYHKTKSLQQYEIEKKLNAAKNDNRDTLIFNQDYSEQTLYGTVTKGTIHYKNFSYSGLPISKIFEDCATKTNNQGCSGYWYSRYRSSNTYNVSYSGPSHQFGYAYVKIYCQRKYSNQGLAQIKQYQELNKKAEEGKKMAKIDMDTELQRLRELDKYISQASHRVSDQLKAEKLNFQKQINILEVAITSTQKQITASQQTIQNFKNNLTTIKEQIRVATIDAQSLQNDSFNNESQLKTFQDLISQYHNTIDGMTKSQKSFSNINITNQKSIQNLKAGVTASKDKVETLNKQIQSEQENISKQRIYLKQQVSNIKTQEEKIKSNNSQIELSRTKLFDKNEQFQLLKQVNRLLELNASIIVMFLAEYQKKNPLYF